jgi:beta-glucosidase
LNELDLSANQLSLARAMLSTGKRVVLILNEGRPRIISSIEPGVSAIVHVYLPGNYGGDALADILAGEVNPSGKLPVTYPRYANSLTPYIHKYADQVSNPQGAYDYSADFNPQFPFGFGLSYTSFRYSDLKIDQASIGPAGTIGISVKVENTGTRSGKEVVQVYVGDLFASITPDVKRLRRFAKIELQPGNAQTVSFRLPVKELAFINLQNKKQLEAGEFRVEVNNLSASFFVNQSAVF